MVSLFNIVLLLLVLLLRVCVCVFFAAHAGHDALTPCAFQLLQWLGDQYHAVRKTKRTTFFLHLFSLLSLSLPLSF
jgi:hypothetical protein